VSAHRLTLCAILLYLTLDLSLPMMPGVFEFAPADCVETTRESRTHQVDGILAPSAAVDPVVRATAPVPSVAVVTRRLTRVPPALHRPRAMLAAGPADLPGPH
jgi:hypothetical protein